MSGDDLERARDRRRVGQSWLNHATEDLRVARVCMELSPPSLGTAAYLCQQAAEKAVKGLLVMADVPFTRTHDLQRLGTLAAPRYPECADALLAIRGLTAWNFVYRYPGLDEAPEPSLEELGRRDSRSVSCFRFLRARRSIWAVDATGSWPDSQSGNAQHRPPRLARAARARDELGGRRRTDRTRYTCGPPESTCASCRSASVSPSSWAT